MKLFKHIVLCTLFNGSEKSFIFVLLVVSLPSNVQDMADCYGLDNKDDLQSNAFPITYQLINRNVK